MYWTRTSFACLLCLTVVSLGCQETEHSESNWDFQNDHDAADGGGPDAEPDAITIDVPEGPDGGDADAAPTVDVPEPKDGPCMTEIEVDRGELDAEMADRRPVQAHMPHVDEGSVYYHRPVDDEEADGSSEVFRLDVESGEESRLTHSETHQWAVAAANGRVLVREDSFNTSVFESDGERMSSTAMNADATLPYLEDYSGGAQRPFDGEHFLFSEIDDGIHLIDADGSPSNHNHPEYGVQPRPVVTDDGYAFTRRSGEEMDGPVELFTYAANTAEAEPVTETEATESHPYGDDGDLYWRSDDGVYRRPDGGDPARLLEGNCTAPHASDGLAAFACTDDEDAQWEGLQTPAADELHVFDGNRTRKIHSVSDGAYV
ncbi:MAG: hypothetical protein ACOCV2_14960, partial [Persicimonas sp.]